MPNYVVVVLGDIGRSPRMQNHSVCLSKLPDANVHIVGYYETPLFKELSEAKNVLNYLDFYFRFMLHLKSYGFAYNFSLYYFDFLALI